MILEIIQILFLEVTLGWVRLTVKAEQYNIHAPCPEALI